MEMNVSETGGKIIVQFIMIVRGNNFQVVYVKYVKHRGILRKGKKYVGCMKSEITKNIAKIDFDFYCHIRFLNPIFFVLNPQTEKYSKMFCTIMRYGYYV